MNDMKQLPTSILALILGFAFFFNIERIDFQQDGLVNVSTLVYILVTIASLVSIRLRAAYTLSPAALILFWQAIYLFTNMFLLDRPFHGDLIYVYVTEITFLSVIVLLSQRVALHLRDFEEAVENITLADLNRPHKALAESIADVQNQMYLSRRHDRPLSVIVLKTEQPSLQVLWNRAVLEVQQAMMGRYVASRMIRVLDHELRRTDLLVHNGDGSFVVVCPETSSLSLQTMIERICDSFREQLGISVLYGTASFPENALTFEELLSKAEAQLTELPQPAVPVSTISAAAAPTVAPSISQTEIFIEQG
jgi:hypothetical protein